MNIEVIDNLEWHYTSEKPYLRTGNSLNVADPTPCYNHPYQYVKDWVEFVEFKFPIDPAFAPTWYLPKFETIERVNAWTQRKFTYDPDYDGPKNLRPWTSQIVLIGKRTPLHPAMTRYLVAHEYGHVIHFWLQHKWEANPDVGDEDDQVYKEYAQLRGINLDEHSAYSVGQWDNNIGEVFANDFRLIICQIETEFWPHSLPRPTDVPGLADWWYTQKATYESRNG
jgi:hypothetical protein